MVVINFYILINIKTGNGFQTFGKFFLGTDGRFADNTFRKMKGTSRITKDTIINLEFTETKNELPQNIQMISCTLDEIAENCKIITKETFKHLNMADI